jgi:CRP/FNR family transcriptional regulator, cyclic AMP receptor protein
MGARYAGPDLVRPRTTRWPEGSVLGSLPETAREGLLALGRPREFALRSTLIMEGDTSTDVIVLIDGWVKVVGVTDEGGRALLALRAGGDVVGEQSALEGQPRSASVISAGATLAHVIGQRDFLRFLDASPVTALAISRALSAKLRWSTRRRIDFSGLPVRIRLARVLSELARLHGRPVSEGIEFGYSLTQPELAEMVGASEPSVHKTLRQFRGAGMITTGYRRLVICDPLALGAIAEPSGLDAGGMPWNGTGAGPAPPPPARSVS